jgi:hypothetical protein
MDFQQIGQYYNTLWDDITLNCVSNGKKSVFGAPQRFRMIKCYQSSFFRALFNELHYSYNDNSYNISDCNNISSDRISAIHSNNPL